MLAHYVTQSHQGKKKRKCTHSHTLTDTRARALSHAGGQEDVANGGACGFG